MSDRTQVKLFISPDFRSADAGDGGVRRVVEAQRRYLPSLGFDIVDDPAAADLIACHSGDWIPRSVNRGAVRVVHCHGLYWDEPQYKWWAWAKDRNAKIIDTFRKADLVVSPAEWVANILRRDLWLDTPVLYNGIELPSVGFATAAKRGRGRPRKDAAVDGAVVGGSSEAHDRYVLWNKARVDPVCEVDSLGALIERMPDVEFVSTFAPLKWMDQAAKQGGDGPWQVGDNLLLTGRLPYDQAIGYVDRAGVYLCTTREVFSVGLLEAMSRGVPVVGYAWGGQREVVRHKVDGWLAPPGDVNGLAAGIEYVLDPANWGRMSQAARSRAADFTWRAQMARCAEIYRSALVRFEQTADRPKVSVIIPCHNMEQFVGQAIDSAIGQAVAGKHEVIVVDDASADRSVAEINAALARELDSPTRIERTQLVGLPNNLYLAKTLNEGIARARGEYVLNLDADNMLPAGALSRLATELDDNEGVDVVYAGIKSVKEDGVTPGWSGAEWPPREFNYSALMGHKNQVQSSAMFRKKVWERLRGYRQHVQPKTDKKGNVLDVKAGGGLVRLNSDADFWCRAATLGFKFKHIGGSPTLIYRERSDSMSHTVQDYDWTAWCPKITGEGHGRLPMGVSGKVSTLEPTAVTVIVTIPPENLDAAGVWRTIESLWPQTVSEWECIVVDAMGDYRQLYGVAPYCLEAGSIEEAVSVARGSHIVFLQSGEYLHPEALSLLIGAIQWSVSAPELRDDMRSRFAYADWVHLETNALRHSDDQVPGVVLFPRSFVSASLGVVGEAGAGEGWVSRAAKAGLCGQYVEAPLLVRPWSSGGAGGDKELAGPKGCGCGGGARRAAPGGVRGCVGPGCVGGKMVSGGRTPAGDAKLLGKPAKGGEAEAMVLLRYKGPKGGRSILGVSRDAEGKLRRYNFGSDKGHHEKYVYTSDVATLMASKMFERVQVGSAETPVPDAMKEELVGAAAAAGAGRE